MGSPLSKSDRYGSSRIDFGKKYGKSITQLHKALKEVQNEVLPDEVNLYQTITGWAIPNVRQQNIQWNMELDEEFFKDYTDTFGKLFDKLPKQFIHRDHNPSNILFNNGEVSGFIDLNLSEVNIRLWDACYCATGIFSESSDKSPAALARKSIFRLTEKCLPKGNYHRDNERYRCIDLISRPEDFSYILRLILYPGV